MIRFLLNTYLYKRNDFISRQSQWRTSAQQRLHGYSTSPHRIDDLYVLGTMEFQLAKIGINNQFSRHQSRSYTITMFTIFHSQSNIYLRSCVTYSKLGKSKYDYASSRVCPWRDYSSTFLRIWEAIWFSYVQMWIDFLCCSLIWMLKWLTIIWSILFWCLTLRCFIFSIVFDRLIRLAFV